MAAPWRASLRGGQIPTSPVQLHAMGSCLSPSKNEKWKTEQCFLLLEQ